MMFRTGTLDCSGSQVYPPMRRRGERPKTIHAVSSCKCRVKDPSNIAGEVAQGEKVSKHFASHVGARK